MNKSIKNEKRLVIGLLTGIVILLAIILFSSIFYIRSSRPMRQAEKEATELARQYANIETVDDFYWFTREKTYFSIVGKDNKNQSLIVVVPKSGEQVTVFNQADGITENDAKEVVQSNYPDDNIRKINFGMFEDKPVWEVMTAGAQGNNYYLIDFKKGNELKAVQNI